MRQEMLGGKLRFVGYPESLCLSCEHNFKPCSLNGKADMELCPDYKMIDPNQKRLFV